MTDECGLAEATATRPLTHDDLKKQSESTAGSHSKKPYMLRVYTQDFKLTSQN